MLITCCMVGVPEAALSIEASGTGAVRACTLLGSGLGVGVRG